MKTDKGFTLIELIIYIGLMSIMLLGITSFTKTVLQTRTRSQVIAEVEQQGVQVMQILTQTIRNAASILSPGLGSNNSTLILDVVNPTADPTTFSLSNNSINIQEGGGSLIELTNSRVEVQNLIFQNFSRLDTPGLVKFNFTLNYKNYSKAFYGSASLR